MTNHPSIETSGSGRSGHPCALAAVAAACVVLTACGSDGSSQPQSIVGTTSNTYAQQCSANNPYRQDSDAGTSPTLGSLSIEKQWVRAYVDEAYLWYSKVPNINAAASGYSVDTSSGYYTSIDNYFSDLTVNPVAEDRFSFTYPTKAWKQLSESAVSFGYGISFYVGSSTPPRVVRVAFVEPNSAAATAGVQRGDTVVSVDGYSINDATSTGIAALNEGIYPTVAASHSFVFSRSGSSNVSATMAAASVTEDPVPYTATYTTGASKVGYVVFNSHVLPAETKLVNAITTFKNAGVSDLVVDLRYNGGGYLFIASELAYMVAGANATTNKVFEHLTYNDKRSSETNASASYTPFYNTKCVPDPNNNYNCTDTTALPVLNFSRVWVLTTNDTCSASEAIVNGLRGIDVDVRIIGSTTCGKPYGFTAKDNCGVSYFPIEFQGVNNKGTGDYASGFTPTCSVADDFDHQLGDTNEGMLAAALYNRSTGTCNTSVTKPQSSASAGKLLRGPERSSKIYQKIEGLVRQP